MDNLVHTILCIEKNEQEPIEGFNVTYRCSIGTDVIKPKIINESNKVYYNSYYDVNSLNKLELKKDVNDCIAENYTLFNYEKLHSALLNIEKQIDTISLI